MPTALEDFGGGTPTSSNKGHGKKKLNEEHLCPSCGTSDTEEVNYYRRCNDNSCDTVTYLPVQK